MSEPSTDEKIQQLVRSVLLAVDSRLDAVRHELAVHAAEEEQRHHLVLGTIAALERRVGDLERSDAARRSSSSNLLERLDELNTRIDMLAHREHTAPPVTGTHEVVPPPPDLDRISRPLFHAPHVTTQVPIVPPLSAEPVEPAPAPAPAPALAATEPADDEAIDVDRLTALLSEKLGHFSLQPHAD